MSINNDEEQQTLNNSDSEDENLQEFNTENLDTIYNLRNTLFVISIFYLITCLFAVFFNNYYIIAIVLLLFGLLGINKFNNPLCTYFLVYCLVRVGLDIYMLYLSNNDDQILILCIFIFFELFIIHLLSRFMLKIYYISYEELQLLNDNYYPTNRRIVLY